MPGELDPVSQILGALQESKAQIITRLDKQDEAIASLQEARWKRIGFTAGIGAASGFFASVVAKIPGIASILPH